MKYGQTEFEVHLPPELIAAELEPNQVDLPQRTTAEHIRWALDHPIDSAPLKELVKAGDKVCVVISDVTRRWQAPDTYLPILIGGAGGRRHPGRGHPDPLRHRHPPPPDGGGAHRPGDQGRCTTGSGWRTTSARTRTTWPMWAPPAGALRSGWTSGPWPATRSSSPAAWCTTSWRASAAAARASCRASPAGRPS